MRLFFLTRFAAVAVISASLVVAQSRPSPPATQPATLADDTRETQKFLDRQAVLAAMKQVPLGDVIEFARDFSGANIYVDYRALKPLGIEPAKEIDLAAGEVTLLELLKRTCLAAAPAAKDFSVEAVGNVIFISTKAGIAEFKRMFADDARAAADTPLVKQVPEVKFEGIELGDCLDFLRDMSGKAVGLDPSLPATAAVMKSPVTLRGRNFRLHELLRLTLLDSKAPLDFAIDPATHAAVVKATASK